VIRLLAAALAFLAGAAAPAEAEPPAPGESLVYFGTYTGANSRGIYVSRLDLATGHLTPPELAAESEGPSFLALHPSRPLLYAVNEVSEFEGEKAGSVSAFAIDEATGRLRLLNRVSSKGGAPCHLVVDATGRSVLVANYSGGSVASLPVADDGRLGPASAFVQHRGHGANPDRQAGPHAHAALLDAANRTALVADLGLDQILAYRFDAARGALDPADPPSASVAPGSGPRHLAFTPDGRRLYVVTEMAMTVTGFRYEAGRLTEEATTSLLPEGQKPGPADSGAEIVVHPSGRFLYTSSRGPDVLTAFAIDGKTGRLTFVDRVSSGGKTPRNFAIDPSGRFVLAANQRSDSVVAFRIDEKTGRLTPTGQVLEVGSPVCVVFRSRSSGPR
jgi:6-phosphogluconolactonase